MALSQSDLNRIHLNKLATPNKKYYGDDEEIYLGTKEGRLEKLDKAKMTTFKPTTIVNETNIQSAVENLSNQVKKGNKKIEIDFGTDRYQKSKVFNIVDLDVLEDSIILVSKSLIQPSDNRKVDEIFVESLDISVKSNNKNFDLYVKSLHGTISGKFIINYKL